MTTGVIIGDREIAERFKGIPDRLRDELRREIRDLTTDLQGHIKGNKLTGQVLNVRTGNLRRNINQRVVETGSSITGIVGTNVEYARLHEFGGTVKEHLREIRQVFGRPLRTPITIKVQSYQVPERSFMRSGLEDRRARIEGRIGAALTRCIGG